MKISENKLDCIGNITENLSMQAQSIPHEIAIFVEDFTLTFQELEEMVWRIGTYFTHSGITCGERVAILCKNDLTIFIALLSLARIGATSTVLQSKNTEKLLDEVMSEVGINRVILDYNLELKPKYTKTVLNKTVLLDKSLSIDYAIYDQEPLAPFMINHGSGTTGKAKLIPIYHEQLRARIHIINEMESMQPGDRIATLADMEFSATQFRAIAALFIGATAVLIRETTITLVHKYQVTHLGALLFQLDEVINSAPNNSKELLGSLKSLSIGFSTISDSFRQRIRHQLSSHLYIGYGTNECGAVSMAVPPSVFSLSGTVGHPLPGVKVEIVNADHKVLPYGNIGLIRIKSPGMINGYLNDEASTKKSFRDGWFYPNDLGKLTEEGELIHLGRADDMMILNGINIYPTEIEQTITSHRDVEDAVAMPIKSDVHQDIPVCAVSLSKNSNLMEEDLLNYASKYLGIRSPKMVIIFDTIPRTAQGKPIRKEIIQPFHQRIRDIQQNEIKHEESLSRKYTQYMQAFSIEIHKNMPSTLINIDKWFSSVLDIRIEPLCCRMSTSSIEAHKHSLDIVWRILLLSQSLLQAIHIPIFDTGEILKFDDSNSEYFNINLLIPYIDHIPKNIYIIVLRLSSQIILNFMKNAITDQNIQKLYQRITKEYIDPYSHISGSERSTMQILQEAYANNIPFKHLKNGIYQLGWGHKAILVNRSFTAVESPMGTLMSQNKILTASLLRDAGLPTAKNKIVRSEDEALLAAKDLGWPIVVKPLDRNRGEGVSVDIINNDMLRKAFISAYNTSRSKQILIEKQVSGVSCRIFIADQKMLYAVKKLPKSVIGNAKSSVKELIMDANSMEEHLPPWKRSEIFSLDELAEEAMPLEGFTVDSIPRSDEIVPLRKIDSAQWGGIDEDITNTIHPDNIDLALRSATLFGLHVAGIDIITPDISTPWYLNGAIVNEVKFSPEYGKGEISKNIISAYLNNMIESDGRIPITVLVGDNESMDNARKIQMEQRGNGLHSFITSHKKTLKWCGSEVHFETKSLFKRCQALLMDQRSEALILVVQTDELLYSGLPVDFIDTLVIHSSVLYRHHTPEESVAESEYEKLVALLKYIT